MRKEGRLSTQLRAYRITPNYTKHATGSVLIETGDTKVLCSATAEDGVPSFLRKASPPQGWLTAEYSMLPSATNTRNRRERQKISGRTQEIQRLIGRSLRGIVDLKLMPDTTITIDCDVIQADGGTRTASITGAYVALKLAIDELIRRKKIKTNPITEMVAAVSIGMKNNELLVDLNYEEDSTADLDMNVVMTQEKKILEIQGTAEGAPFCKDDVVNIIDAATDSLAEVFELQQIAGDGVVAES